MIKKLREHIFNVGLFACIPAVGEADVLQVADALVAGKIRGIILSWNKRLTPVVEKLHARYPQVLIGAQGPYEKTCQLFASGVSFVVDTANVPSKIQVPFLLRKGNDLIDDGHALAQCSNKLVFVKDIKQQKWADITQRTEYAVKQMLGFELYHVGINHPNAEEADKTASRFERLFGFPKTDRGGAYFAGRYIEAMKKQFYGTHGHLAIATCNVARTVWYMEQYGVQFNWKSADYNTPDGSLRAIYLQEEIGGFAVHLVQK